MPARLPLTASSALASSTSWRASRLVCSESCLTSSAIDASDEASPRVSLTLAIVLLLSTPSARVSPLLRGLNSDKPRQPRPSGARQAGGGQITSISSPAARPDAPTRALERLPRSAGRARAPRGAHAAQAAFPAREARRAQAPHWRPLPPVGESSRGRRGPAPPREPPRLRSRRTWAGQLFLLAKVPPSVASPVAKKDTTAVFRRG